MSGPVHLADGAFSLPSPLEVTTSRTSWTGPVSNDALRTGTYAAALTFTLSTTTP